MKVRIERRRLRRRFRKPLETAGATWRERESLVIRLEEVDGRVGFGEVAPVSGFPGESLEEAEAYLSTWVPGAEVPAKASLCRAALSCARSDLWRKEYARRAVETARLVDLQAVAFGEGRERHLPPGSVYKVKVGAREFAEERQEIAAFLKHLPKGGRVRLDANGGLTEGRAGEWLAWLSKEPMFEFLEQPLPASNQAGLARLNERWGERLALDESVADVQEACRWMERGWRGSFVMKPSLCGDLRELEGFLADAPHRCVVSAAFESPFGFEANLRLAAETETVAGLGVLDWFEEDALALHQVSEAGVLHPGEVTLERLEALWKTL